MPLWTLIFLGGRMAIPQDLYDAADIDGASPYRRFAYITVPLLANLYVISTLISTIWTFGDYAPVLFVSAGTPAFASEVLSTLGFHYALDFANPPLGDRGRPVDSAAADSGRDPADAPAADDGGAAMMRRA